MVLSCFIFAVAESLRSAQQPETPEAFSGFWRRRWGRRAPARTALWRESASISAAPVPPTPPPTRFKMLMRVLNAACVPAVRQCEQPLQCELKHLLGCDPVRYDLSGWFGLIQNNPSWQNATWLLQNSSM